MFDMNGGVGLGNRAILASILMSGSLVVAVSPAADGRELPRSSVYVWTPPVGLSPKDVAIGDVPGVLLDDFGNATVAWIGNSDDWGNERGLVVRRKLAGSQWEPRRVLDPNGLGSVALEADAAGNVTIAYGHADGPMPWSSPQPYAVTGDPSGVFEQPVSLSADGVVKGGVQLVVGPDGTATAAWRALLADRVIRVAVAQRPSGKEWEPVRYISPGDTRAFELTIDVGSDGDITALWSSRRMHRNTSKSTMHARTLSAGHWSQTSKFSYRHKRAGDPEVAAGPNGTVLAAWTYIRNYGHNFQVTAQRHADGTWTKPRQIPAASGYDAAEVAIAGGRQLVLWTTPDPTSDTFPESNDLMARVKRAGTWSQPVMLSEPGGSPGPTLVEADNAGRIRVVWAYQRPPEFVIGTDTHVQTRVLALDGQWSPITTLGGPDIYSFSIASSLGSGRSAAVVWTQLDPSINGRVRYTELPLT